MSLSEAPRPSRPKKLQIPPRMELLRKPLVTERLVLEPIARSMSRKLFRAVEESRETLLPWLPWVPFNDSPAASEHYTEACERDWDSGVALRFSLRAKDHAPIIGAITLESCVHLHRSCDLGYWLHPAYTGQGMMTEAATHVLSFAFEKIGFHRIRCAAGVDNTRSRKVIERLGFSFEGTARDAERVDGRWVTHAVYSRLATDPPPSSVQVSAQDGR